MQAILLKLTLTPTEDIVTIKLIFNRTVSTLGAKFLGLDLKYFYLNTPADIPESIYMKLYNFLEDVIKEYNLMGKVDAKGFVILRVGKEMYGLSYAGIIAQKLGEERLELHDYKQIDTTPGFSTNKWMILG